MKFYRLGPMHGNMEKKISGWESSQKPYPGLSKWSGLWINVDQVSISD